MARTATSRLRTQVVTEENGCAYQDYHGWWMREDDGLWHYRSVHGSSDNGIASPFGNAPVEIRIIKNFWHWVELPKATAPAHPTSGEGGGGGVNEDPYSEYRIEAEHRAMTPTPPTERAERDWPGPQNYIGVCAKCDEQYSGSKRDIIFQTCYACYQAFAKPTPDTEARRAAEWMRSEDEKWKRRHAARVMALAAAVEAIREEGEAA